MELFRLLGTVAIENGGANAAIDETTGKAEHSESRIASVFGKIGTAAVKLGKTMAAGLAVGATAVTGLAKSALDSYAEYEQLVGGVDTLFKESSDKLQGYASDAYKTAGMSANEYMDQVTSFAASLIQSLDGDTEEAAEKANQAIIDMSDNANKMGTAMESIQNAYQGFAKQNYTMLDNLKLGYGGTKEEMQRLLSDAEAISGVTYDISSYADVVDAIHVIQTEMGITGTTAKEASSTISGSIKSMKSAWSNFVTELGKEDADMSGLIDQFVNSVQTAFKNIAPRIKIIKDNLVTTLTQGLEMVADKLPFGGAWITGTLIPLIETIWQTIQNGTDLVMPLLRNIVSLVTDSFGKIRGIFNSFMEIGQEVFGIVSSKIGDVGSGVEKLMGIIKSFVEAYLNSLIEKWQFFVDILQTVVLPNIESLIDGFLGFASTITETVLPIIQSFFENARVLVSGAVEYIVGLFQTILENITPFFETVQMLFQVLWDVCLTIWETIGQPIFDMLSYAVMRVAEVFAKNMPAILGFVQTAVAGIKDTWENHLKPVFELIGQFIETILMPIFKVVFDAILEYVQVAFETIALLWTEVLKPAFDGICDFIVNVFQGNWKGAWQGIVDTFETVFGGLVNVAKVPINAVIGYVNKAIDAINGLSFTVPDWVPGIGGEDFGFNIPNIPKLAHGGVLEQGQVGLLEGSGAEAVVPLENNTEWISKVAQQFNGVHGNDAILKQILDVLREIREALPEELADSVAQLKFEVSNREFARLVKAVN